MGECQVNTNFLTEERDLREAQELCSGFTDANVRNNSIASHFAAKIAEKFFSNSNLDFDTETSLHCLENIVSKYEISDVYVNGNYIDIRFYFDEQEIGVPKQHYDDEMLPLAYMFIKLQPDLLSQAEVTGFMLPDTITVIEDNEGYYPVNENAFVPFEEIEYLFRDADDLYNVDDAEIYTAIDENMAGQALVKKLLYSLDGRKRFKKAYNTHLLLKGIEITADNQVTSEKIENNENPAEAEEIEEIQIASEPEEEYHFTTVVSANLTEEVPEETESEVEDEFEIFEKELELSDTIEAEEKAAEDATEQTEDINTLFDPEQESVTDNEEQVNDVVSNPPKKKSKLPLILLVLLLAVGGYFGYTKFAQSQDAMPNEIPDELSVEQTETPKPASEAMPVETVEQKPKSVSANEGNSVSIPAIEHNLDASILVSNLRIDWEVPNGYVANTQAKRYLVKLGKIIQLNLKAELLLLNKPPISNKIAVELKYNPSGKCFETVGITASSGEKIVDDVILRTVQKALETKLSISTESFEKLSGNPVIVIRL